LRAVVTSHLNRRTRIGVHLTIQNAKRAWLLWLRCAPFKPQEKANK